MARTATKPREEWASHYHRCKRCGGFFSCEQENSDACAVFIAQIERDDCQLGIDALQFEARHSTVRQSLYALAEAQAD